MGANPFPNVIGAVDGTHIRINPPNVNHNAYFNRKKSILSYYNVFVNMIYTSRMSIQDGLVEYMMPGC